MDLDLESSDGEEPLTPFELPSRSKKAAKEEAAPEESPDAREFKLRFAPFLKYAREPIDWTPVSEPIETVSRTELREKVIQDHLMCVLLNRLRHLS
jgi:hypothetical protein